MGSSSHASYEIGIIEYGTPQVRTDLPRVEVKSANKSSKHRIDYNEYMMKKSADVGIDSDLDLNADTDAEGNRNRGNKSGILSDSDDESVYSGLKMRVGDDSLLISAAKCVSENKRKFKDDLEKFAFLNSSQEDEVPAKRSRPQTPHHKRKRSSSSDASEENSSDEENANPNSKGKDLVKKLVKTKKDVKKSFDKSKQDSDNKNANISDVLDDNNNNDRSKASVDNPDNDTLANDKTNNFDANYSGNSDANSGNSNANSDANSGNNSGSDIKGNSENISDKNKGVSDNGKESIPNNDSKLAKGSVVAKGNVILDAGSGKNTSSDKDTVKVSEIETLSDFDVNKSNPKPDTNQDLDADPKVNTNQANTNSDPKAMEPKLITKPDPKLDPKIVKPTPKVVNIDALKLDAKITKSDPNAKKPNAPKPAPKQDPKPAPKPDPKNAKKPTPNTNKPNPSTNKPTPKPDAKVFKPDPKTKSLSDPKTKSVTDTKSKPDPKVTKSVSDPKATNPKATKPAPDSKSQNKTNPKQNKSNPKVDSTKPDAKQTKSAPNNITPNNSTKPSSPPLTNLLSNNSNPIPPTPMPAIPNSGKESQNHSTDDSNKPESINREVEKDSNTENTKEPPKDSNNPNQVTIDSEQVKSIKSTLNLNNSLNSDQKKPLLVNHANTNVKVRMRQILNANWSKLNPPKQDNEASILAIERAALTCKECNKTYKTARNLDKHVCKGKKTAKKRTISESNVDPEPQPPKKKPSTKSTPMTGDRQDLYEEFGVSEPGFKYMHKLNAIDTHKHPIELHETYACKVSDLSYAQYNNKCTAADFKREVANMRQNISKQITNIQTQLKDKSMDKESSAKLKMRIKFLRAYKQMKLAECSYSCPKLKMFSKKMERIFTGNRADSKGSLPNKITNTDIQNAISAMGKMPVDDVDLTCIAKSLENYITLITLSVLATMVNKRSCRVTRANISSVLALQYAMNHDKESYPMPEHGTIKTPSDGKLNVIICRNVLDLNNITSVDQVMEILMDEFSGELKNLWVKFLFYFKPSSDYFKVIKEFYIKYIMASYMALCKMEEKRFSGKPANFRQCMAIVINNCTWFPFKDYANHTDVNLDRYADDLFEQYDVKGSSTKRKATNMNRKKEVVRDEEDEDDNNSSSSSYKKMKEAEKNSDVIEGGHFPMKRVVKAKKPEWLQKRKEETTKRPLEESKKSNDDSKKFKGKIDPSRIKSKELIEDDDDSSSSSSSDEE